MNRALAAAAVAASLAAGAASAQGYQQPYPSQPGYGPAPASPQQGYGPPQGYAPPQGYGRPSNDRRDYDPRVVQRPTESSPIYPDRTNGDRRYQDDPRSIDPAPGARGPYVGAGRGRFYNIEGRIARVESRMAGLPAAQRRRAYAEMRIIRSEESVQRSKHGGDLRDWDRERLTQRLDALVKRYPGLGR